MAYTNNNGQTRVGVRIVPQVNASSLWNSIYSVYNADTIASPSLKTSLVASYNGESNANDSFGANNGTAVGGLTYTTGKIGNAFTFNGSNSYVSLPNNSWNFTGNFSISMWVKFSSSSLSQILISNFTIGGATTVSGWFIEKTDNAELRFRGYNNGSLVLNATKIAFSPSTSVYTHLVVSRSATNSKIYINGVLDITSTVTAAPNYESTNYPMIGANRYNSTTYQEFFNGNIDGVNIWQKELTQSEITELYNSGNGAQYIGDNFYKPTTNDALGTNNGTAQGGLTYGVGKVGTAFQFNGTNSYILLPRNSLRFTNSFSVSLWTYSTANQTGNKGLFSDYYYPGDLGYTAYITTSNKVEVFFKGGYSINQSFTSNSSLSNNQWNNIVISWDKINTQWKMYINGVLDYTYTNGNANLIQYQSDIYENRTNIGAINSADSFAGNIFNGSIDAFNTWNKVLTQSEVTELYNSGNGKQYPN